MILHALNELAERENLVPDRDFEIKPVSYAIVIRDDGSLVNVESMQQNLNEGTKRKPKYVGRPVSVPRQEGRTRGVRGLFFVDKSEYAFGIDPTGERPANDLADRVGSFRARVAECADQSGDEGALAVLAFLDRLDEQRDEVAEKAGEFAGNDLFLFRLGLDLTPIHERPKIVEFWREKMKGSVLTDAKFRCLVSGVPIEKPCLFPNTKGAPGVSGSDIKLVSFKPNAFHSHGNKANENAPISEAVAVNASTALNRLLDPNFPNPSDPEQSLPLRNKRISSDTVLCYWAASETGDDLANFMDPLFEADDSGTETDVQNTLHAIWSGQKPAGFDTSPFYGLLLTGTQGRAVIRDWFDMTVGDVHANLTTHFDDLRIVRNLKAKKGSSLSPAIPLRFLTEGLAAEGKGENVPAPLVSGLIHAAFTGRRYPLQVLQRALVRERVEAGRDDWATAARRDARAALIRAVLNRRWRKDFYDARKANVDPTDSPDNSPNASTNPPEVPVSFDPALESEGYTLGALMAVLERLQSLALGDVNAGVVDRFFSAASAGPRSVFVRLLKNARHHARKAQDDSEKMVRGQAYRLDRLIDALCARFDIGSDSVGQQQRRYPASAHGLPSHLDLEQQGLFVLGYHQMRHWLWMSKDDRVEWEHEHDEAPKAFLWNKPAAPDEADLALSTD